MGREQQAQQQQEANGNRMRPRKRSVSPKSSAHAVGGHSAAMDVEEWDQLKENQHPLKSGRHKAAFTDPADATAKLAHELQKRELVAAVDAAGGSEIEPWLRLVKWTQENSGGGKAELQKVLESCTRRLMQLLDRYRVDKRFLRVWIQYADCLPDPNDVFLFLKEKSIGQDHALFFEAYATYYELRGNCPAADAVYTDGMNRGAQPLERLKQKYTAFQSRMAHRIQRQVRDHGPESLVAPDAARGTLSALLSAGPPGTRLGAPPPLPSAAGLLGVRHGLGPPPPSAAPTLLGVSYGSAGGGGRGGGVTTRPSGSSLLPGQGQLPARASQLLGGLGRAPAQTVAPQQGSRGAPVVSRLLGGLGVAAQGGPVPMAVDEEFSGQCPPGGGLLPGYLTMPQGVNNLKELPAYGVVRKENRDTPTAWGNATLPQVGAGAYTPSAPARLEICVDDEFQGEDEDMGRGGQGSGGAGVLQQTTPAPPMMLSSLLAAKAGGGQGPQAGVGQGARLLGGAGLGAGLLVEMGQGAGLLGGMGLGAGQQGRGLQQRPPLSAGGVAEPPAAPLLWPNSNSSTAPGYTQGLGSSMPPALGHTLLPAHARQQDAPASIPSARLPPQPQPPGGSVRPTLLQPHGGAATMQPSAAAQSRPPTLLPAAPPSTGSLPAPPQRLSRPTAPPLPPSAASAGSGVLVVGEAAALEEGEGLSLEELHGRAWFLKGQGRGLLEPSQPPTLYAPAPVPVAPSSHNSAHPTKPHAASAPWPATQQTPQTWAAPQLGGSRPATAPHTLVPRPVPPPEPTITISTRAAFDAMNEMFGGAPAAVPQPQVFAAPSAQQAQQRAQHAQQQACQQAQHAQQQAEHARQQAQQAQQQAQHEPTVTMNTRAAFDALNDMFGGQLPHEQSRVRKSAPIYQDASAAMDQDVGPTKMPTLPAAVRPIRGLDVCRLANSGMGSFVQPGTSVRPSGLTHSHSLLAQPMGGGLGGSQRGQAVGMQLHEDTELLHPLPSSQMMYEDTQFVGLGL